MNTTINSLKTEPLTLETLKKAALLVEEYKPKSYKRSWFTRLMNKLGWHRRYEVIFINESFLNRYMLGFAEDVKYKRFERKRVYNPITKLWYWLKIRKSDKKQSLLRKWKIYKKK